MPKRPAAPRPAPPQAAAGQPVTLVATGDVWLRITDGPGGANVFSGSMAAGDRYQLPSSARQPVIRTSRPQYLRALVGTRDLGPLGLREGLVENVSLRAGDLAARGAPVPPAAPAPAPAQPLSLPPAR